MAKELDTSWFDLKNYEPLKSMSIEDWALMLQTRYFINDEYDFFIKQKTLGQVDDNDLYTQEYIEKLTGHLKHKRCSLVDSFEYYTAKSFVNDDDVNNSFSISSVNSLTVIESWDIAEDSTFGADIDYQSIYQKTRDKHAFQSLMLDAIWHRVGKMFCAKGEAVYAKNIAKEGLSAESLLEFEKEVDKYKNEADEGKKELDEYKKEFDDDESYQDFIREARRIPYDFRHKQYFNRDYISPQAHVTINLNATDEQIENDFSHWLTHYRKASGYCVPKKKAHEKLFTQNTFDFWIEFGLIPYLDLMLVAKIEGKEEITHAKYGELIFPDESIEDPEYRIRTVTIPEAKRLMEDSTWWSILEQVAAGTRKKQRVDRYGNKQKKKK